MQQRWMLTRSRIPASRLRLHRGRVWRGHLPTKDLRSGKAPNESFRHRLQEMFLGLACLFLPESPGYPLQRLGMPPQDFLHLIRKLCQNFICVGTEPGQRA